MTKATKTTRRKIAAAATLALGLGVGGYAFTAANTVPDTKAGDGSGTITGYDVTDVHYNLNATNPANIDSVEFTLDSTPVAGSTVKAQLQTGGSWFSCTLSTADATCTTAGATVAGADNLRVVVAD